MSLTYTPARPPNAVIRSLHTAIPARARDHLQRTRSPHELYSPTRSQGPTGGKLTLLGGAAKHHLCPGASTWLQPRVEARNITHPTTRHLRHRDTPRTRGPLPQPPCQLGRHTGPVEPPVSAPAARQGCGSTSTLLRLRPPQPPKRSEATQPHLTARRPRPHSRPLLLPHAHHDRSTARRPLAEMRHLRTNTRPSSCSPSHRAAAAMEHISTKVAG